MNTRLFVLRRVRDWILFPSLGAIVGLSFFPTLALAAPGDVEPGFSFTMNERVYSASVQTDGKVVISGYFSVINGVSRYSVARVNADGTLDTTFSGDV